MSATPSVMRLTRCSTAQPYEFLGAAVREISSGSHRALMFRAKVVPWDCEAQGPGWRSWRAPPAREPVARRRGKAGLIADALEALKVQPSRDRPQGPVRGPSSCSSISPRPMSDSPVAGCVPALIEAAERDEAIAERWHRYAAVRRAPLREALAQGIAQGTFGAHLDPDIARRRSRAPSSTGG